MRLFGSERVASLMDRLGWEENEAIEHPQISRAIESAQKKLEAYHFDIRRQVLEYDDVMSQQRETIYSQRRKVLERQDLRKTSMTCCGDRWIAPWSSMLVRKCFRKTGIASLNLQLRRTNESYYRDNRWKS